MKENKTKTSVAADKHQLFNRTDRYRHRHTNTNTHTLTAINRAYTNYSACFFLEIKQALFFLNFFYPISCTFL